MRKSSMATRWSPGHGECGATLFRRMLRGLASGDVGVKHEIEESREVGSRDEDDGRALALQAPRSHGAAARGQIREDDVESARVDLLPHRALDVGSAHVAIRQR